MFSAIVNPDFKTNQNKTDPKSPLIVTQLTVKYVSYYSCHKFWETNSCSECESFM